MRKPASVPELRPSALPGVSDADLVQRSAAGDQVAFEAIMRRYNQRLFRTARSIVKNDQEAQEVLQDAYMKVWNSIGGFRAESKLSTWLTRIVANQAIGRLRRRHNNVVSLDAPLDDSGQGSGATVVSQIADDDPDDNPEMAAMRDDLRDLLEKGIDQLPDGFRTVFMLRGVQEMDVDEIAHTLGISSVTVRTRYFRARKRLRKILSHDVHFTASSAFEFAGKRCDHMVASVLGAIPAERPQRP